MEQTSKLTQAVTAYKAGDTYAFTALYEESSKYIYSCIYKVMNGNDNAQDIISDIMQDTYVEVSKSVWQLSDDNKFLSWAGMIATRKCYAYVKTNKKYVLLNDDDDTFENISDSDAIIPEEIMEDREKQRLIRNIIDKELTEMQKLCIIAYYYNDMKQSEIAQQFNIPENTVKTNLSRAKAKIKEQVLDLEKNQGTRLYTFTPLLLLLFREEVKAAFVPANITNAVFGAVNTSLAASAATYSANMAQQTAYSQGANMARQTAYTQGAGMAQQTAYTQGANVTQATIGTTAKTATATKGIAGKIAVMSVKAKLISAIATVAVVGVAGVGVKNIVDNKVEETVSNIDEEEEWEKEYRKILLSDETAIGFDLNDFSGDGIPGMVVLSEEELKVYFYKEDGTFVLQELPKIDTYVYDETEYYPTVYCSKELDFGYDIDEGRVITLGTVTYSTDLLETSGIIAIYYDYSNGGYITGLDSGSFYCSDDAIDIDYEIRDNTTSYQIKDDVEIRETIQEAQAGFNEIIYSGLSEDEITARFEEFKRDGNRERKYNEVEKIVEVTESESENIRVLAQYVTMASDVSTNGSQMYASDDMICEFISYLANDNANTEGRPYDNLLPNVVSSSSGGQAYTQQGINEYALKVFGTEVNNLNSAWPDQIDNGIYYGMEAQFPSGYKTTVDEVTLYENQYTVVGTVDVGSYPNIDVYLPIYTEAYNYTMVITKDEESPFGFRFDSISYTEGELDEADQLAYAKFLMRDIVDYPSLYKEYYPADADLRNLYFATNDIDGDGQDELFIAYYADNLYGEDQHPNRIVNILSIKDGKLVELGGDTVYEGLMLWSVYENGMLLTETYIGDNETHFYNIYTGEYWEGCTWLLENEGTIDVERSGIHFHNLSDGGIYISGDEAKAYYKEICQGERQYLTWHKATYDNLDDYLYPY